MDRQTGTLDLCTEKGLLGNKSVDDSMSEFALGKCAMVQNGNWAWSQIKDVNGNYIIPPAGKQVLVIFEYGEDGAFIGVRQVIRDWGVVDDEIIL